MTEYSESVYIRSNERSDGIEWLTANELTGYVFEPRGDWVQVFPDWNHLPDEETYGLLENSEGLLLHYYFAEEQFWAFGVYREGALEFRYEGIWLVDEYATDGSDIDDVAEILEVSADELSDVVRASSESPSWKDLADDAASFADLLELPNYAYASFDYADSDAESLAKYFVGPDGGAAGALGGLDMNLGDIDGDLDELEAAQLASILEEGGGLDDADDADPFGAADDEFEAGSGGLDAGGFDGTNGEFDAGSGGLDAGGFDEESGGNDADVDGLDGGDGLEALLGAAELDHSEAGGDEMFGDGVEQDVDDDAEDSGGAPDLSGTPEPRRNGGDAPWQGIYDLASQFLQRLYDDELIELTLDSELARDRLVERLTQAVIDNPVSGDSQVLGTWFDELMTCPEIVDVFATDAMLEEAYEKAKEDVEGADLARIE